MIFFCEGSFPVGSAVAQGQPDGVHVVRQEGFRWPEKRLDMFAKATGSKRTQPELAAGKKAAEFVAEWQPYLQTFREKTASCLIYP